MKIELELSNPAAYVKALRQAADLPLGTLTHAGTAFTGRGACRELEYQIEKQLPEPRIAEPGLWGVVKACARDAVPRFGDDVEPRLWVHDDDDRGDGWIALSDGNVTRVDFRFLENPALIRAGVPS